MTTATITTHCATTDDTRTLDVRFNAQSHDGYVLRAWDLSRTDRTGDADYVAQTLDDLVEQLNRDGYDIDANEYELIESAAQRLAELVLTDSDESLSWREAGYHTPLAAAAVLVGDGESATVHARASEIIASALGE